MEKRRFAGRNFLTWGALCLFVWTGYEFYVRAEMMIWALRGVFTLCKAEGIPFLRALRYFDASMFYLTGFMLVCALYALFAILFRNKPRAGYALMTVGLLIGGYAVFGLSVIRLGAGNWLQALKFLPLALIESGCVVNLVQSAGLRSRGQAKLNAPTDEPWAEICPDNSENEKSASAKVLARRVREMRSERRAVNR